MGLPGSGKTTLAQALKEALNVDFNTVLWLNADKIRSLYNDWQFTTEGRIRQAKRMFAMANVSDDDYTIADFVCPLAEMRNIFDADFVIWMNTINKSRFDNTDAIFEKPDVVDLEIKDFNYSVDDIVKILRNNYVTGEVSYS